MIHPRLLLTRSQAFRPGNIDLPAQTHVANPTNLILPDQITDLDLLAPMPDPSFLLSQPLGGNLDFGNTTVPDWDNSQFLSGSIEQARMEPMELPEDDLNLDIGEGDDLEPGLAYDEGTSIEVGRNAPLERRQSEEFTGLDKNLVIDDDNDLGIDIGEDPPTELARGPELNLNLVKSLRSPSWARRRPRALSKKSQSKTPPRLSQSKKRKNQYIKLAPRGGGLSVLMPKP
jgi:hypothetical protein